MKIVFLAKKISVEKTKKNTKHDNAPVVSPRVTKVDLLIIHGPVSLRRGPVVDDGGIGAYRGNAGEGEAEELRLLAAMATTHLFEA